MSCRFLRPGRPTRGTSPSGTGCIAAATILALIASAAPETGFAATDVLTLSEAAALLRVSRAELEALAAEGAVPGRRIGRHWRFSRSALLAWLGAMPETAPTDANATPAGRGGGAARTEAEEPAPAAVAVPEGSGRLPPPKPLDGNPDLTPAPLASIAGRGPAIAQAPEQPVGVLPTDDTAQEVFLRGTRVLLDRGQAILQGDLFYARSEDQEISFLPTPGGILLATLVEPKQEIAAAGLTLHYGLLENLQISAGSTLRYRRDREIDLLGARQVEDDFKVPHLALALRTEPVQESSAWPAVIVSSFGRIPIEGAQWALGGGVTLLRSLDPVTLFAELQYVHAFADGSSRRHDVEPENTVSASVGYAFAVNDSISLHTLLSAIVTDDTPFADGRLEGGEQFLLRLGLTTALARDLYLEPFVTFALNGSGSSILLGISTPYNFTLFR